MDREIKTTSRAALEAGRMNSDKIVRNHVIDFQQHLHEVKLMTGCERKARNVEVSR